MKGSHLVSRFAGAFALALVATAALAEQPDKWVRYVESTGSQYVNTGINARHATKIEARVEWMELADASFVSSRKEDWPGNGRLYFCYCQKDTGEMFTASDTGSTVSWNNGWNCRWEKNRVYSYTAEFSAKDDDGNSVNTIVADGQTLWTKTSAALDTGYPLFVFANNQRGSANSFSKTRCYGLKIWQDGALVRDFQPCMKGGKAGLYDAVSDTIFYSISGTDLICDENSEVPDEFIDYVESQGDAASAGGQIPAYIDTGIIGKSATTVEFKETNLNSRPSTEEECVIGAKDTSNRFFMWYHATGHTVGLGYGDTYWRPVTTDPTKAGAWDDSNLYPLNYGDTTHARVYFAAGSQTCTVINDETGAEKVWTSLSKANAVDTGKSLYVFARNNNGAPDAYSASRLYFLKIWQDGSLVRDFRPCLKNGVAGLYDDVSKRIFYSLGTPLVFNNVHRQSVKPKEVVFVEYIESDGTSTLDTSVPARSGIRAAGDMAWTAAGDYDNGRLRIWNHETYRYLENTAAPGVWYRQRRTYLGAANLKSGASFLMVHESDSNSEPTYGGDKLALAVGVESSAVALYAGRKVSFDVSFAAGAQSVALDGTETFAGTDSAAVDTGDTLHLFSQSGWRYRSAARCYGLKIWQDGTLVRDFKPCLVDGKGMLYDKVTETLYRPSPDIPASRVGKIVLSGEEKPACYVDYVETDGKVFIDTGVIGKAATTAEFKETSMQKRSDVEECFLGSFGNDARFYVWYHAWAATAGIGYGEYWRPKKNDPYTVAADSSDPDVYKLNSGDTTHARVSFTVGVQTFSAIDDATGTETLYSSRTLSTNVDTGRNLYLFANNDSDAGTPVSPAASRFYFLKIWQGDSDGSNMRLVRNYKPVKLSNGLVALWDFVEKKAYRPQSTTAPYDYTTFPVVGPDGEEIRPGLVVILR